MVFLTGTNLDNKELGANAVGKSTIWDALCWVLYGKTASGLKAGEVRSWGLGKKEECSVRLTIKLDGVRHTITRTQAPNSLQLSLGKDLKPEDIDQERVDRLIGLSYAEFLQAVLISQFGEWFLDMAPTTKTAILSSLLGVEFWDGAAEEAGSIARTIQEQLQEGRQELAYLRGQFQQIDLEALGKQAEQWEASRKVQVKAISDKLESLDKLAKEKVAKDTLDLGVKEGLLRDLEQDEAEWHDKFIAISNKWSSVSDKRKTFEVEVSAVRKRYEEMKKTKAGKCRLCGTELSPAHIKKELKLLKKSLAKIELKRNLLLRKEKRVFSRMREIEKTWTKVDTEVGQMRINMEKFQAQAIIADSRKEQIESERKIYRDNLVDLLAQKNPHTENLLKAQATQRKLREEAKLVKSTLRELKGEFGLASYWVKEFKAVKLFILDNVLAALEVEINEALERLGLRGWAIRLSTDKVSKTGDRVQKKLHVVVHSPDRKGARPWTAWSGGERQRLRLAAQLGLANLVLNRRGVQTNLQVFDEPTAWLSQEGVRSLLDVLQGWAMDSGRALWLLDHRTLHYSDFAVRHSIIMHKGTSRLQANP